MLRKFEMRKAGERHGIAWGACLGIPGRAGNAKGSKGTLESQQKWGTLLSRAGTAMQTHDVSRNHRHKHTSAWGFNMNGFNAARGHHRTS